MSETLPIKVIKFLNSTSYDEHGKPFMVWGGKRYYFEDDLQFGLVTRSFNDALRGGFVKRSLDR